MPQKSQSPAAPAAPQLTTEVLVARLAREGAQSGDMTASLIWNNASDLDLHVICPEGHISYQKKRVGRGHLDVDMNAGAQHSTSPVENVFFVRPTSGRYQVFVHNYHKRSDGEDGDDFKVFLTIKPRPGAEEIKHEFSGKVPHKGWVACFDFALDVPAGLAGVEQQQTDTPCEDTFDTRMAAHPFLSVVKTEPLPDGTTCRKTIVASRLCQLLRSEGGAPICAMVFGPPAEAPQSERSIVVPVEAGESRVSGDMLAMLNTSGGRYAFWTTALCAESMLNVNYVLERHNSDVHGVRLNAINCLGAYETVCFDTDSRNGRFMTLHTVVGADGTGCYSLGFRTCLFLC